MENGHVVSAEQLESLRARAAISPLNREQVEEEYQGLLLDPHREPSRLYMQSLSPHEWQILAAATAPS